MAIAMALLWYAVGLMGSVVFMNKGHDSPIGCFVGAVLGPFHFLLAHAASNRNAGCLVIRRRRRRPRS